MPQSDTRERGLSAFQHATRPFPPSEQMAAQANAQPGMYAEAAVVGASDVTTLMDPTVVNVIRAGMESGAEDKE
jgi:hypothetical protein